MTQNTHFLVLHSTEDSSFLNKKKQSVIVQAKGLVASFILHILTKPLQSF